MPRLFYAALALVAFAISPAIAQTADDVNSSIETVLGDHAAYEEAFQAIQVAVAEDDAEAVAQWVAYPFNVTVDGEDYSIEGPEGFIERYDGIVTEEVKSAVVDQKYENLFVSADGVMFGNGQMWLNGICRDDSCAQSDVKITTIQTAAE